MLGVFAKVTVKPQLVNRFWQYLEADATGSRQEPGCLRFDILRDDERSNVFYLYEVYRDKAAYAAHQQAPYFKAFFAEAGDTLDGAPEVHMTTVVSPEGTAYWSKAPA
jgi:autoinducer 2-degrading protein